VDLQRRKAVELDTRGKFDEEGLDALNTSLRKRRDTIKAQLDTLEAPLQIDFRVNRRPAPRLRKRQWGPGCARAMWSAARA
jgi:hypothetical protein